MKVISLHHVDLVDICKKICANLFNRFKRFNGNFALLVVLQGTLKRIFKVGKLQDSSSGLQKRQIFCGKSK